MYRSEQKDWPIENYFARSFHAWNNFKYNAFHEISNFHLSTFVRWNSLWLYSNKYLLSLWLYSVKEIRQPPPQPGAVRRPSDDFHQQTNINYVPTSCLSGCTALRRSDRPPARRRAASIRRFPLPSSSCRAASIRMSCVKSPRLEDLRRNGNCNFWNKNTMCMQSCYVFKKYISDFSLQQIKATSCVWRFYLFGLS